ncbi:Putative peptidoglycan binding domain-containing protein [Haloechinothrix alba]|uniref:Putative peptidoglycan binding domain-containing protein n=1 Tax=Haloechinothrix alba TaxID=664784 RepID=A0A238WBX4_9PSEU|nr:peptidoglycan-binding domain-containing protein [Haloechinothrix alba]SNR43988.1 Putative peptidoglycan binding domain-containing protein [Haloechinothrix alba]
MSWRVARSLETFRNQLDAAYPNRDTASDGTIGDEDHQNRQSDHNPWYGPGIVTAFDFTHDPDAGVDIDRLTDELEQSRDPRIKYVIANELIMSGAGGPSPWVWRAYNGVNPHTRHAHLSVVADDRCDDPSSWNLPSFDNAGGGSSSRPYEEHQDASPGSRVIYGGRDQYDTWSHGSDVGFVQRWLGITDDDYFGPATHERVRWYQDMQGITVDGEVGPETWSQMGK